MNARSISRETFSLLATLSSQSAPLSLSLSLLRPLAHSLSLSLPALGLPSTPLLDLSYSPNFPSRSKTILHPKVEPPTVPVHSMAINPQYLVWIVRVETWRCIVGFTSAGTFGEIVFEGLL